jgi:predicted alpha/beta superfamily hydrolase
MRFVLSPRAAVFDRLEGIESFMLEPGPATAVAALPPRYARSRRRRYPLVILANAGGLLGSAIEMSRLLAGAREVASCLLVAVDTDFDLAQLAAVAAQCRRRYRVAIDSVALFAHGADVPAALRAFGRGIAGVTRCIVASAQASAADVAFLPVRHAAAVAWTTRDPAPAGLRERRDICWKAMPESPAAALAMPALMHGLLTFWATGHDYGAEVVPLAQPLVARIARALSPLLRPLTRRPSFPPARDNPLVLRASQLARDFEIFVALPDGALAEGRRYPAIVALDANGGFATVAETAARLAAAGDIGEAIVVGIGTPRAQGELEFAFRRFEELSPPHAPDYRFDDPLGRFFRALYALRGQDARVQLGQAPGFHDFIARELLPLLCERLPIERTAITLVGHSAAGTFVGYALAQPQSPFASFLCLSPGVDMGGGWMLAHVPAGMQRRVFVALGSRELANRFNIIAGIPKTPDYVEHLRRDGASAVECHVLDGETHTTVYARALAQGLCAALGAPSPAASRAATSPAGRGKPG